MAAAKAKALQKRLHLNLGADNDENRETLQSFYHLCDKLGFTYNGDFSHWLLETGRATQEKPQPKKRKQELKFRSVFSGIDDTVFSPIAKVPTIPNSSVTSKEKEVGSTRYACLILSFTFVLYLHDWSECPNVF